MQYLGYSETANTTYLAWHCPDCGAMQGDVPLPQTRLFALVDGRIVSDTCGRTQQGGDIKLPVSLSPLEGPLSPTCERGGFSVLLGPDTVLSGPAILRLSRTLRTRETLPLQFSDLRLDGLRADVGQTKSSSPSMEQSILGRQPERL